MANCTIFKNLFDRQPYIITVDKALDRILKGNSGELVNEIRQQLSKDRADQLKANLPAVCFSGEFSERKDSALKKHSGFIVLDFDEVDNLRDRQQEIINHESVYACWVSPRGNGLKALVRVADGSRHRHHFAALRDIFPDADKSGVNESRVCYESYDPDLYLNKSAKPFKGIKETERYEIRDTLSESSKVFENILKWLTNRGDAFVTGERNTFIFKLAGACCRFGIDETDCQGLITGNVLAGSTTFSKNEADRTIKSAYRGNKAQFGTAVFEREKLIEKITRREVEIDPSLMDETIRPKDVIFGEDVKAAALNIYENGYEKLAGIGVQTADEYFKLKKGEISLLSGIGNYGKSSYWHWYLLMRSLKYDDRFAFFSPESNPAEEFYHDFVECLLGCDCTPYGHNRPGRDIYQAAYDWVSKRIFYVYPKEIAPTPAYIKERFLELIIKEKVAGVLIDPFNQLANDYGQRSDKYLESFLSDCSRFAQVNQIFFTIIAHPKLMRKDADGNYPCPDIFDIADGAMWNNKMDNILIYHRPNHQKEPNSPLCEIHTKKIRRQKTVGKKGVFEFEYYRPNRRYFFEGSDPMQKLINEKQMDFMPRQKEIFTGWKPYKDAEEF